MDNQEDKSRWRQVIYVLMPFVLLLACLAFINFVPQLAAPVASTVTPVLQSESETAVTAVPTASVAIATSTPSPTPTIIPTPTLPPGAAIELLGPPDGSSFRSNHTVVFYADWPFDLMESQQLVAYVRFEDQPPLLLGVLDEPNIGQRYRWQLNAAEMVATAVSFEWWIELQSKDDASPLLTSPARQVTLLP